MSLESERCVANLYLLAKKKNLRIGDLETSCGVSVGYLARLRQDQKKPLPGLDFLFRAAHLLDTTVDSLLSFDFHFASETDQYLHAFLTRLLVDTVPRRLVWDWDTACRPSPDILDAEVPFPDHPLLSLDARLMGHGRSKVIYASHFRQNDLDMVPRKVWRASLSKDSQVFLVCVGPGEDSPSPEGEDRGEEIELYLYQPDRKALFPLCHTDLAHPGILDHDLRKLCAVVEETLSLPVLNPSAVAAIDAYMGRARQKS